MTIAMPYKRKWPARMTTCAGPTSHTCIEANWSALETYWKLPDDSLQQTAKMQHISKSKLAMLDTHT